MHTADHLDTLAADADLLLEAASGSLDRPVAGCPGWDVSDLVVHIGLTWGWAADIVASGERAERGEPPNDRSETPLIEWAKGQATRLLATLRSADPDSDCWSFCGPRTKRFWIRRQALETALHAWDVTQAAGRASAMDPDVAADGLDEQLTVMVPRSVGRRPEGWTGQSFHFHRTDGGHGDSDGNGNGNGEWVVVLGPDGAVDVQRAHAKADIALRGTAEELWLWACNRVPLDSLGLEVFGDRSLADRWTDTVLF